MGYKKQKDAPKYKVKDGDTLESVASAAGVTVSQLTLYNWGTAKTAEVNRALFEIVGARKKPDGSTYYQFSGKDKDATRGTTGELLKPVAWTKQGLGLDRQHAISVHRQKPMPAVAIEKLDKWFVPGAATDGGEVCEIKYSLEGIEERADKVGMEVHASNYSKATLAADGKVSFTAVAGTDPVYKKEITEAPRRKAGTHAVADYRGESEASDGALKPRSADDKRYLNVAFSPYCVMMRFYKQDADKEARILLEDFWPRWDDAGAIKQDSLKVKWKVSGGGKLKHGQLVIWDKSDKVVFRESLPAAKVSADGDYQWDGKHSDGTAITADRMPYRVQLQAHSGVDEDNGLALAVAHTEVRLFVHKDTGSKPAAEAFKEPKSLYFSLAPLVPEAKKDGGKWVTKEPTSGDKWYQFNLGRMGFYPGPVDGSAGTMTSRSLKEFQRSFPKTAAPPHQRLNPNGNQSGDTKSAMERALTLQTANGRMIRPWFGNPAQAGNSTNDPDLTVANALARLNAHAAEVDTRGLVIWVDDRHYYGEANADALYMGNYHGDFTIGDQKVNRDADATCRPWLPLQVDMQLLKRDSGGKGLEATDASRDSAALGAVGPLRVDWRFEEIGENLDAVDSAHASYTSRSPNIRSNKWIDATVDARKATQDSKDYTNCPETLGGIRPSNLASYYKMPFGTGNLKLDPWAVFDDSGNKVLCTLVHDDLGQDAAKVYPLHLGRSGVYLRLSRVAGDGYRFQAAVSFEKVPGGSEFPNAKVLKRRYAKLPRAHTTRLRLWRKTSYRGYVAWCPTGEKNWPGHAQGSSVFYKACQTHFIHEGPRPVGGTEFPLTGGSALITPAEYSTLIQNRATGYFGAATHNAGISFSGDYVWPWHAMPRYGIRPTGGGVRMAQAYSRLFRPAFDHTWYRFRSPLLMELLKKVESKTGLQRGHFLTQFKSTPGLTIAEYVCSGCTTYRLEVVNNLPAAQTLAGQTCTACNAATYNLAQTASPYRSVPLPACGLAMGATWLFRTANSEVWAHELGHHKHLEHAVANPGGTSPNTAHNLGDSWWNAGAGRWDSCGAAPGAKPAQHDSQLNTRLWAIAGTTAPGTGWDDPIHPDKDFRWDKYCIMSYEREPMYFCGKCILKIRGWRVEGLTNPGGGVTD